MIETNIDKGYNDLAKAIVTQAVDDYKRALKEHWALEEELGSGNSKLVELEKFFNKEWCYELSEMESEHIRDNAYLTAQEEYKDEKASVTITLKKKKSKVDKEKKED